MEVHIFTPGDRTSVIQAYVSERDKKRLVLKSMYNDTLTMEIAALEENVPLNHDMQPPHVKVVVTFPTVGGQIQRHELTGYLYDMNIMSNAPYMIVIYDRQ